MKKRENIWMIIILLLLCGIAALEFVPRKQINKNDAAASSAAENTDTAPFTPENKPGEVITEGVLGKTVRMAEEEKRRIEADMLAAGRLCRQYYLNAERTPSELRMQEALRQDDIDAMENALIHSGCCTQNSDAVYPDYPENPEVLTGFWQNVKQQKSAEAAVWSVYSSGAIGCHVFQYENGKGYCIHALGDWNEKGSLELTSVEKKEILYWDMTESGFIYQDIYPDRHWDAAGFLRLSPVNKDLYDLTLKYILPMGYKNVNLFLLDWDSDNPGHLCFNDMLDGFYQLRYGEKIPAEQYLSFEEPYPHRAVPAKMFEDLILPHFDIPKDEFRKQALYDAESKTYPWQEVNWENVLYYPQLFPEVIKVTEHADKTVTLLVKVICPDYHTDRLFEHEVTVSAAEDGTFRYLSNKIVYRGEHELPSPQTRMEAQHFDAGSAP